MRPFIFVSLLIVLLSPWDGQALAQTPPSLKWKAALLAGDNQIDAFDNATKALKNLFLRMGLEPANIKDLSASPVERLRGALPSSAENLEVALRDLSVGTGDACLVHLTSHGTRQGFYLKDAGVITPARLNAILDRSCGGQPTVVLISACYSGVFTDRVMLKPNRVILTAAAADRTSFGCSTENQYTYWDGCLIDNLTQADNWRLLYGAVRQCVETKEARNRFTPSLPLAYFGEAIADLKTPGAAAADVTILASATSASVIASRCLVASDATYGVSPGNPVQVGLDATTGPERQIQYLNALRGLAGQPVRYRRVGTSLAAGVILDIYELTYEGLSGSVRVYLDSYHFQEPQAPAGFMCPIAIGLTK